MTRKAFALILLLLTCLAVAPTAADAASRGQILRDCEDGTLTGSYTPAELRDARQNIPLDLAQYSDCALLLRNAEIPDRPGQAAGTGAAQQGPSTATDGTGGSVQDRESATTPGDAITLAEAADAKAQTVDGPSVSSLKPGAAVQLDRSANTLPKPLLVVLVALGLTVLAATLPPARRLAARLLPRS